MPNQQAMPEGAGLSLRVRHTRHRREPLLYRYTVRLVADLGETPLCRADSLHVAPRSTPHHEGAVLAREGWRCWPGQCAPQTGPALGALPGST